MIVIMKFNKNWNKFFDENNSHFLLNTLILNKVEILLITYCRSIAKKAPMIFEDSTSNRRKHLSGYSFGMRGIRTDSSILTLIKPHPGVGWDDFTIFHFIIEFVWQYGRSYEVETGYK